MMLITITLLIVILKTKIIIKTLDKIELKQTETNYTEIK